MKPTNSFLLYAVKTKWVHIKRYAYGVISCLALSLICTRASASESQMEEEHIQKDYGYVGMGVGPLPFPLPVFLAGYRGQKDHHGVDIFTTVSTIVKLTQLKMGTQYLHYFHPNLKEQLYAGGGVSLSALIHHKTDFYASPEFVFGKQYVNEQNATHFLQAQISFSTLRISRNHNHRLFYMPLVIVSYGIGF